MVVLKMPEISNRQEIFYRNARKLAEENKLKGEEVNYLKDYLEIICRRITEMEILDRQTLPAEP